MYSARTLFPVINGTMTAKACRAIVFSDELREAAAVYIIIDLYSGGTETVYMNTALFPEYIQVLHVAALLQFLLNTNFHVTMHCFSSS